MHFVLAFSISLQDAPPPVDEAKVDQAIKKGVEFLRGQIPKLKKVEREGKDGTPRGALTQHELVLWTLVHAGVSESDPDFKTLFKDMIERPIEATYCAALQAMILEELQRVKWQWRIRQCAQFLVDNQCKNGQWSYGSPTIYADDIPSEAPKKDTASAGGAKKVLDFSAPVVREKPKVKNRVKVEKKKDGPASGDNSNTQYAALGSRACHDAGVILPEDVVQKALAWWKGSQKEEGGESQKLGERGPDVATGGEAITAEPRGWCYGKHEHKAYGSMTAGATGGLAIWLYIKDNDDGKARSWKKDKDVHEGLAWLAKNFSVTYNPGFHEHADEENSQKAYYYYLYGLERAGMLYGTDWLGAHAWYPEGAKVLVEGQKPTGAWGSTVDTCFAILFLKRATRPLVATEPAGPRK